MQQTKGDKMNPPRHCPECKADLKGDPIPEANRQYYGKETHWCLWIGLYDMRKDRTTHYMCPKCKHRIER